MKTRTAAPVAVLVAVACTRYVSGPPPSTTVGPTNTNTAAPTVELQPGPHSALADVDLPEGTVQCTTNGCPPDPHKEYWDYSAPYDDVVAFLRKRFATGRRYDTHGATWWNGLPPCYDKGHQSPPWGHTLDGATEWVWADAARMLAVDVNKNVNMGSINILEIFNPEIIADCYRA